MALLNRNLRIVVKTGKITVGRKNVLRNLRTGQAKLLIIADNLPEEYKKELMYHIGMQSRKIDVFTYPGSSWDLGNQAGRPATAWRAPAWCGSKGVELYECWLVSWYLPVSPGGGVAAAEARQ